jgi:hypothetical protein
VSLLKDIQGLWERTYAEAGIDLELCVVGPVRCAELTRAAGRMAQDLSCDGRTFLRQMGDRLYIAIFYAHPVVGELERNDPRKGLNERNIAPFITFVEEIAHSLQAALLFREGERQIDSESFARNLELQAKIDTYLVLAKLASLLCGEPLPKQVTSWLHEQLFDESHRKFSNPLLQERYAVAQETAQIFLKILKRVPIKKRQAVLQEFRALSWHEKTRWISARLMR